MQAVWTDRVVTYDGSQLRGDWLAREFGLAGDAIVAFRGPCAVSPEHMMDLEDLEAGSRIEAREMLHFIVRHEDSDLARAVLRQRLFASCVLEELVRALCAAGRSALAGDLRRAGDDLFLGEGASARKLSVSVATRSRAGGTLIHFGVDIDPAGAPVSAVGLAELGVRPEELAGAVMRRYAAELADTERAASKVREAP